MSSRPVRTSLRVRSLTPQEMVAAGLVSRDEYEALLRTRGMDDNAIQADLAEFRLPGLYLTIQPCVTLNDGRQLDAGEADSRHVTVPRSGDESERTITRHTIADFRELSTAAERWASLVTELATSGIRTSVEELDGLLLTVELLDTDGTT